MLMSAQCPFGEQGQMLQAEVYANIHLIASVMKVRLFLILAAVLTLPPLSETGL